MQCARLRPQRGLGLAGQHDRQDGRSGARLGHRFGGGIRGEAGGGLLGAFQDDVRVGAAHAEGRDADAAGPLVQRPRPRLGEHGHLARRPVDVRGRLGHVQGLRQDAVAHRHDALDDSGDTGGGLRVPDVGLERAQPQRPPVGPVLAVRGDDRLRLDGVAEAGSGAVRLHGVHLVGGEPGVGQRLEDDALLGGAVGGGQAVGGTVLVDGRTADDGEDVVALAAGVGEPLHEEDADALGEAEAVGVRRERLAAAVGGQAPLLAVVDEGAGRRHQGGAAREGELALSVAQRLNGQVQGDERGGAGGVDGDGGAFEAEGVREAARGDARRVAGAEVALHVLGGTQQRRQVVVVAGADEHADLLAAHRGRVDARALEGLPGGLQEQALLRVHGEGLARGDPEERGVEPGEVPDEAALVGVAGARVLRVGVVDGLHVPAALGGESGDGVDTVDDQLPQFLGRGRAAGVAAAHADDGDGVLVPRLDLAQSLTRLLEIRRRQLQVVPQRLFIRHLTQPPICSRRHRKNRAQSRE
ncbi:hypothetical protein EES37_20680 [Streptomyces sp. ADI91-18]|nr:hypothetical protein EES37_20680 [Streptomyces sp. ADI91-18]